MLSIIERKLGLKYAIIISSLAFALCHIDRLIHAPLMIIYGFILGYAFSKVKNIILPITAHALSNLILYLYVVLDVI
ncbi:MAG: hypothetical protein DRJ38_05975 [Thermoprotei archaeon]|nr:MAG: hypothetical protein DRJ38_05975 [Thermoprotei archaeon]